MHVVIASFLPWLIAFFCLGIAISLWLRSGRRGTADLLTQLDQMKTHVQDTQSTESRATQLAFREAERALTARMERMHLDVNERLGDVAQRLWREHAEARLAQSDALKEMATSNATQLAAIRASVNEQLSASVEKQMQTSFARVVEQFAEMQKAIGEVTAVSAQIGDLKRLFTNVKTRGGWGEAQLRAILDDILPPDAYECNFRIPEKNVFVEFAIKMPSRAHPAPYLSIDCKFPTDSYERLLSAIERADAPAERIERRNLETAIRLEARKMAEKYIAPPSTVEFAVLYLPTNGLYSEIARIPGLIDELGRVSRIIVMGPSIIPALLRTVHLGYVTIALEERTDTIARLLGVTRQEIMKMDSVLEKLAKGAGTMSNTIEAARRRTRVLGKRLRELDAIEDATGRDLEDEI